MGAPYFQIKEVLRRNGIKVFSSNYALYGDMSERVMSIIESMVPATEVYRATSCSPTFSSRAAAIVRAKDFL